MKINWKNYVDQIYSVTCTSNKEQIDILKQELDRVDILDSGIYTNFINVDSPFYELIYNNVYKIDSYNPFNGATKLTYAVYYLLRLSYEMGYERIMIMEDDLKLLKDKEKIIKILDYVNNTNVDFDIICCNLERYEDHFYDFINNNDFMNNIYYDHLNKEAEYIYFSCSTLNIYSRSGMKKLIDFFEHTYCVIDRYNLFMLNIPDMNIYALYPWLCIQQRYAYDLCDLPEIINNYNLNEITDSDVYHYIDRLFTPVGVNDIGNNIVRQCPLGLHNFTQRILDYCIKDKNSDIYKYYIDCT